MTARSGPWVGYLEALAAACLWGSSGVFAVTLFRLGIPPESVALLRPVVGAAGLLAIFGVLRPSALKVSPVGAAALTFLGGAAVGVFQVAYQMSTDAVGVPRTVALLYLAPALVVTASGPLLGEWPGKLRVLLATGTVGGVWLSVAGARDVTPLFAAGGIEWGVLAGASYASYTLFGRWATPRFGSAATVVYSTVGACLVLTAVVPPLSGAPVLPSTPYGWVVLVAFGLLTISLAQLLFFDALGRIEADRASTTAAAEPVVAAVLAGLLLGQGLDPMGWLGLGVVAVGVAGVGLTARRGGPVRAPGR